MRGTNLKSQKKTVTSPYCGSIFIIPVENCIEMKKNLQNKIGHT